MLFNKNSNGGTEIHNLLGFVSADINYDKLRTWIRLSVRQITAITGTELYQLADAHYNSANYEAVPEENPENTEATPTNAQKDELVHHFQLANALFGYVKFIPSLDAGHSNSGRTRSVGDTERSLTAVEAYKDEANILSLAYEAMEALISFAETTKLSEWINSPNRKFANGLLVPTPEIFNRYYILSSSRMFYTLTPMLAETERVHINTSLTPDMLTEIKTALTAETPTERQKQLCVFVSDAIRPAIVFNTLSMALQRLPIEIFPEGIFQTQIVGTVKEKLAATDKARQMLIDSFSKEADKYMTMIQDTAGILSGKNPDDIYIMEPKSVATGFRF